MRVAALTTLVAGARAMSLKAGAQVPKFAVTAHTGAAVSSDSLAGSAYCLWFYPKADTGGATRRGDSRCLQNRPRDAAAMACWAVGLSTTTPRHRRGTRASCVGDATPSPRHSPSAAGVETATVAGRRLNRGGAGVHGALRPVQGQGLRPLRRELRRRRGEQGLPREVRLRVSVALRRRQGHDQGLRRLQAGEGRLGPVRYCVEINIEQASRRWRAGRRDDSAQRAVNFDFHTAATSPRA